MVSWAAGCARRFSHIDAHVGLYWKAWWKRAGVVLRSDYCSGCGQRVQRAQPYGAGRIRQVLPRKSSWDTEEVPPPGSSSSPGSPPRSAIGRAVNGMKLNSWEKSNAGVFRGSLMEMELLDRRGSLCCPPGTQAAAPTPVWRRTLESPEEEGHAALQLHQVVFNLPFKAVLFRE